MLIFFSIRDSLRVERLFLSDKKDKAISCYIHRYLSKVRSIPSLRMHELLKILEHAFSLLDEFSSIHVQSLCFQLTHFIVISCLCVQIE